MKGKAGSQVVVAAAVVVHTFNTQQLGGRGSQTSELEASLFT